MRRIIELLGGFALTVVVAAGASGSAAAAGLRITVVDPPPHTLLNTPYVSDGRLLAVDDSDGDVLDVSVTLDRGTIMLGAAPDADVVDAGGDGTARVIGTSAEIKPALDRIVITPDTDDQHEITGAVWVDKGGQPVAGHSLRVIVDDGSPSGQCAPHVGGTGLGGGANHAPVITAPAEVGASPRTPYRFRGAISIADPDAGAGQLKIRLSVPEAWWGDFTLPEKSGLTFVQGDGITDYQVAFCGTLGALNTALAQLEFTPGFNDGGHETFTMTVDDLGNSGEDGPRTASARIGVYVGEAGPRITVVEPAPHTPFNTPYVSNGRLLAVDDINGDMLDVRITLDRGSITLGAAPDAEVIDAGGDGDVRVIGAPAQIKPALDGIVITPNRDDGSEITGAVWVESGGQQVAGHSLRIIVDALQQGGGDTDPGSESDGGDTRGSVDPALPAESAGIDGQNAQGAVVAHPVARAFATHVGQRIKLSARGSRARQGRIVSYRWTGPHGRVLSRKATVWVRVHKRKHVTLVVVDSQGYTARTTLVVEPLASGARRP